MGLLYGDSMLLSFACTKESNQRKVQPIRNEHSLVRVPRCELAFVKVLIRERVEETVSLFWRFPWRCIRRLK
jgi:hypothetical protein